MHIHMHYMKDYIILYWKVPIKNIIQSGNEPHLQEKWCDLKRCDAKSPGVQDTYMIYIAGLISSTGMTRRQELISHAQNAVRWLSISVSLWQVATPQTQHLFIKPRVIVITWTRHHAYKWGKEKWGIQIVHKYAKLSVITVLDRMQGNAFIKFKNSKCMHKSLVGTGEFWQLYKSLFE